MNQGREGTRIIVIGGGLAGLTAATLAARAGATVTLLERAANLGGRAGTRSKNGFSFNQGPHALYRGGPAERTLAELGVQYAGRVPRPGAVVHRAGRLHLMPMGVGSLIKTGLLSPAAKLEFGAFYAKLGRMDPAAHDRASITQFVTAHLRSPVARDLAYGLFRLATYSNAPGHFSAGAAIRQLQLGGVVLYVDGGWQTIADSLAARAEAAGVEICTGARVEAVRVEGATKTVMVAGGLQLKADAVIVTGAAQTAAALLPGAPDAHTWASEARPAMAACLDIGLSRLPVPDRNFALSADEPFYYSVHSATAQLGPEGTSLVSVARYIPDGETPNAAADLAGLEAYLDVLQPGWRALEIERQYLPSMPVQTSIPLAVRGGLEGRPPVAVRGMDGVFVAGDWVGAEGLLADAVIASAREAAGAAIERTTRTLAHAS